MTDKEFDSIREINRAVVRYVTIDDTIVFEYASSTLRDFSPVFGDSVTINGKYYETGGLNVAYESETSGGGMVPLHEAVTVIYTQYVIEM